MKLRFVVDVEVKKGDGPKVPRTEVSHSIQKLLFARGVDAVQFTEPATSYKVVSWEVTPNGRTDHEVTKGAS